MRKLILITCSLTTIFLCFGQNVGINETGATPDNSALLDIDANTSNNKGVLIPRINLVQTTSASPVLSPANSLLVYNLATANDVTPGYYYWDGSNNVWVRFQTEKSWLLHGNIGTTPSSSPLNTPADNNFIGTTDNQDVTFVANGYEKMRIKSDGPNNLRIGMGTTFVANYNSGSTPSLLHINDWGNTVNDFAALNLTGMNIANNSRQGVINFAAAGAIGTATDLRKTASIESYLEMVTPTPANQVSGYLSFYTNNANNFTEKMRIKSNGNVRVNSININTTDPTYSDNPFIKFSVTGGFAYFGNFNCDPNINGNNGMPGHNFNAGVGALAIGMNRSPGSSGVDFWNTTSNGQSAANGANDRGFYFRNYNTSGNEQLLAYIRLDGVYAYAHPTISDQRSKTNIQPLASTLEKIMQVKTYNYTLLSREFDEKGNIQFVDLDTRKDFGFLAQEVYDIFPEMVSKPVDEDKETWAIDYSKMVVILTKAIQEQQEIINELKEEVQQLQEKLNK